jgi:hypothetical protein
MSYRLLYHYYILYRAIKGAHKMTQYYPGPYEVEIQYVESGITHKQRLNCNITVDAGAGQPFSAFSVQTKAGGSIALNTAVDAYVALMKVRLAASTNITVATLYKYVPESFEKNFKATYNINLVGTSGAGVNLNHQTILTFVTALGNPFKWTVLDDASALATRIPIKDAVAALINIANYLVGTTTWIIARDGAFPVGQLNSCEGQNEALNNRRNRPS